MIFHESKCFLSSKQSKDGLNAVPTTNKEKTDCKKILSPQELHQVIIGIICLLQ